MLRKHMYTWTAVAMIVLGGSAQGASMSLSVDPTYAGPGTAWKITAVTGSYADAVDLGATTSGPVITLYTAKNKSGRCGNVYYTDGCGNGPVPVAVGPTASCQNSTSYDLSWFGLVGRSVIVPSTRDDPPTFAFFACSTNGALYGHAIGPKYGVVVHVQAIQPACIGSVSPMTFRGMVGAKLKATTELQIHCDSPATVRVTMPSNGVLAIGGGGEVVLTFQKNGKDVLDISGRDPLVSIDGELTKSPTTAGTYQGSTVVSLDVL